MKTVIYYKGAVAFLIPFLAALGIALQAYRTAAPTLVECIIIVAAVFGAGVSGLGSFLSTSFADHKAEQAAQNPPLTPPVTGPTLPNPTPPDNTAQTN